MQTKPVRDSLITFCLAFFIFTLPPLCLRSNFLFHSPGAANAWPRCSELPRSVSGTEPKQSFFLPIKWPGERRCVKYQEKYEQPKGRREQDLEITKILHTCSLKHVYACACGLFNESMRKRNDRPRLLALGSLHQFNGTSYPRRIAHSKIYTTMYYIVCMKRDKRPKSVPVKCA